MSEDAGPILVQFLEVREECFWELFRDVRVHLIPFAPWLLRRVNVEAGTAAKVVCVVLSRNLQTACEDLRNFFGTTRWLVQEAHEARCQGTQWQCLS